MNKTERGFTFVELIIVLAVIGILASVILPRINTARDRGIETKIVTELEGFHKLGMSEQIVSNTFNVVCGANGSATSTKLTQLVGSLRDTSDLFVCNSTVGAFAASAQLNDTEHWCVDSAGAKRTIGNALGPGVTTCP